MLIFDGDCGFCTTSAGWVKSILPPNVAVQPWQALDLESLGLTEADVTSAAYWVDESGATHRGHRGIGEALKASGQPWSLIGILIVTPPVSWLASLVYGLVAKNRYRLPGSTDSCKL
ncbi:MAG: DUF393 domain-containing protein [Acidimicrobiales bacterium]